MNDTATRPDCFAELVLAAQQVAAAHEKPFFLTEYNSGLGGTNRDDASGAAFLFRNVGLLQKLDMWSWWTFTDGRRASLHHKQTLHPPRFARDARMHAPLGTRFEHENQPAAS